MDKHLTEDEDKLIIEPIDTGKNEKGQPKNKSIEIPVVHKTQVPPVNKPDKGPKEYKKYVCMRCRYKFTRKSGTGITLRCPYCGKSDVQEDTFDINRAISEVE